VSGVRIIRAEERDSGTAQTPGMTRLAGVAGSTCGASGVWMGEVKLAPGFRSQPHHHGDVESAIYVISGRISLRWGERLEHAASAGPGEFIFVPAMAIHQEINESADEAVNQIVARGGDNVVVNVDVVASSFRDGGQMTIEIRNGEIHATPPFTDDDVAQLRAGDHVLFHGTIYTARDAAHRRMVEGIAKGTPPPMDLKGQVIYYVGPTPARPGRVIGSAGPTTAMRLDPFTPTMLEQGLKVIIGKGGRGSVVKQALQEHKAVYLLAIGGAGALLSKTIKSLDVIAYEDLGTESIKKLEVDGFPAIVCCDMYGGDLLLAGKEQYRDQSTLGEYVSVPPAEKAG
jgi:fumarate hydratase subunit beta